jgi:hypothetical protein
MSPKLTLSLAALLLLASGGYWFATRKEPPADEAERRLFADLPVERVRELRFESGPETGLVVRRDGAQFVVTAGGAAPRRAKFERCDAAFRAVASTAWLARRHDVAESDWPGFGLDAAKRRSVVVVGDDGRERRLDLGTSVRNDVLVALVDRKAPVVEVDATLAADLFIGPEAWIDRRVVPGFAPWIKEFRVHDRADGAPGYVAFRESARWFLREPEAVRGDQTTLDRLTAYLCAVEAVGAVDGPPPTVALRVSSEQRDGAKFTLAFGAPKGDVVPVRLEPDGPWETAPRDLYDGLAVRPETLRTRLLFDVESSRVVELRIGAPDVEAPRIVRLADGFVFVPPASFGWNVPAHLLPENAPATAPPTPSTSALDPIAAARLLEGLCGLEASAFLDSTTDAPELEVTALVAQDAAGRNLVRRTALFGPDREGRRQVRIRDGGAFAVRSTDAAFLFAPFYTRLARFASSTMPYCVTAVEVREAGGRAADLKAASVDNGAFVFEKTDPAAPGTKKKIPATTCEALRTKVAGVPVKEYVAYGVRPEHGFDAPKYVVRFKDTVQRFESRPEVDARGGWITWRVGAEASPGLRYAETDARPGLVFTVELRDLDPLVDLLNW